MSEPSDKALYARVKAKIYRRMPKHSAYRSGHVVREYKRQFRKKHPKRQPYVKGGKKPLRRWFKEKWTNQRGGTGYKRKGDVYRPTKRVSRRTPTTFSELSQTEIRRAQREKRRTGRVRKF